MQYAISHITYDGLRRRQQRGLQLVEAAIILPVLLLLMGATAEFGNYFYTYTTLSKATRASARYISSKAFTASERDRAIRLAVCGNPNSCASQTPVLGGLTTGNIQITSDGGVHLPDTVTVRITGYHYQPVFDIGRFFGAASLRDIEVSPSTTMRYTLSN